MWSGHASLRGDRGDPDLAGLAWVGDARPDRIGNGMTGPGPYCRGCGRQLRPGLQFCTECGRPAEAVSPPGSPRPGRGRPGRRPSQALLLALAVPVVAALAAVVIVVVHPFGHHTRTASQPPSSPAATRTAVAGTSAPAAPDPSSPASPPSASPSSPAGASSSSATPEQAATSLAALLARSATDRQAVDNAYNDAVACGPNASQDARAFEDSANSHSQLLSELAQLPGQSALSQQMLGDLKSAWQASASADDDYAKWAQDEESSCSAGNESDPDYMAATAPNLQATANKKAFVRLWDPLADNYGLATYQQDGF
jgi:cytoskeletal protein RodZ